MTGARAGRPGVGERRGGPLRVAFRRLRRAAGLTEASVVWLWRGGVLLAVLGGLGLAVLAWRVPEVGGTFVARLERVTGVRLVVARAALGRAGLRPAVVLTDVRLAGPAPGPMTRTHAARVRLGLSWRALFQGRLQATTLVVEGLETTVECTPRGRCRWLPQGRLAGGGSAVDPDDAAGWLGRVTAFEAVTLAPAGVDVRTPEGRRLGHVAVERVTFERLARGFRVLARADLPDALGRYVEFETQVQGDPAQRAGWRGDWVLRGRNLRLGWTAPWQAPGVHLETRDLLAALHGRWQDGAVAALAFDLTARRLAALRDTGPLADWREVAVHGRLAPPGPGHPDVWWGRLDSLSTADWRGASGRLTVEACAVFPDCPTALALDGLPGLVTLTPWLAALRYTNPAARFLESASGELEGVIVARGAAGLAASGRVNGFARPPGALGLGLGPLSGRFALNADRGWFVPDPGQVVSLSWPAILGTQRPRLVPRSAMVWQRRDTGWWLLGPTLGIMSPGLAAGVVIDPEISWPGPDRSPKARVQARLTDIPWAAPAAWLAPGEALAIPGGWPTAWDGGRVLRGRLLWTGPLVADARPGQARRDAHWLWRGQLAGFRLGVPGQAPGTPSLTDGAGVLALSPEALSLSLQAGRLGGLPLGSMSLAGRPGHGLSWQAQAHGPAGPAAGAWLPVAPLGPPVGHLAVGGRLEVATSGRVEAGAGLRPLDTRLVAHDLRLARAGQGLLHLTGRTRRDADGRWLAATFSAREGRTRYTGQLHGRSLGLDGVGPPPSWLDAPPPPGADSQGLGADDGEWPLASSPGLHWHAEVLDPDQAGRRVGRFDWRLGPGPPPDRLPGPPAPTPGPSAAGRDVGASTS